MPPCHDIPFYKLSFLPINVLFLDTVHRVRTSEAFESPAEAILIMASQVKPMLGLPKSDTGGIFASCRSSRVSFSLVLLGIGEGNMKKENIYQKKSKIYPLKSSLNMKRSDTCTSVIVQVERLQLCMKQSFLCTPEQYTAPYGTVRRTTKLSLLYI